MTVQTIYADVMGDLRSWLRTHPYLTALQDGTGHSLLNARVFFRIPDGPTFPLVRIYRAGGANQDGQVPLEDVQAGIDVWGGSYTDVVAIANAIKAALHLMNPGTRLGSGTVGLNADVIGEIDAPDPDTGNARKVLTALLTVRAA
jgi:hypothetical protein